MGDRQRLAVHTTNMVNGGDAITDTVWHGAFPAE